MSVSDTNGKLKGTIAGTFGMYSIKEFFKNSLVVIKTNAIMFTATTISSVAISAGVTTVIKNKEIDKKLSEINILTTELETKKLELEKIQNNVIENKSTKSNIPKILTYNFMTITGEQFDAELINTTETHYILRENGKQKTYLKSDIFKYTKN